MADNSQTAYNYFVGQGLSPAQASGIVGNLQGESGQSLNSSAISQGDGSDGSDSIGIAQWNGNRAAALKAYADSKGLPWTDLNTQLEFLHSELQGPEGAAYKNLQAAQTPEDAAQAMLGYERPKDWNKPGSHPERARYASAVMAAYGGGQPQAAQVNSPSPANVPPAATAGMPSTPYFPASAPSFGGGGGAPVAPYIPPAVQPLQIQYAQRRPVDLSRLQATLARPPTFSQG